MKLEKFQEEANSLLESFGDFIETEMEEKGLKAEDCQKQAIRQALGELYSLINGTEQGDLESEDVEVDTEISMGDVYRVANDLCIGITEDQISTVMELYPEKQKEEPNTAWHLVVEDIIINL